MNSLFCFTGYVISIENGNFLNVEGEFDISTKTCTNHPDYPLKVSHVSFREHSFLNLRLSNIGDIFEKVEIINFVFDPKTHCYIAEVFSKNTKLIREDDSLINKKNKTQEKIATAFLFVYNKQIYSSSYIEERISKLLERESKLENSSLVS